MIAENDRETLRGIERGLELLRGRPLEAAMLDLDQSAGFDTRRKPPTHHRVVGPGHVDPLCLLQGLGFRLHGGRPAP